MKQSTILPTFLSQRRRGNRRANVKQRSYVSSFPVDQDIWYPNVIMGDPTATKNKTDNEWIFLLIYSNGFHNPLTYIDWSILESNMQHQMKPTAVSLTLEIHQVANLGSSNSNKESWTM